MNRDIKDIIFYICAAAVLITFFCGISAYFTDKHDAQVAYNSGYEEGYDNGYVDGIEFAKENWNIDE